MKQYGYSKLGNVLYTNHLQRRLVQEGFPYIKTVSLHPGSMVRTSIYSGFNSEHRIAEIVINLFSPLLWFFRKNEDQGS